MQDTLKPQCIDCLHPQQREILAKIFKFMNRFENVSEKRLQTEHKSNITHADQRHVRGLCTTCLQKDDCQEAATQGGIWHCKNYL